MIVKLSTFRCLGRPSTKRRGPTFASTSSSLHTADRHVSTACCLGFAAWAARQSSSKATKTASSSTTFALHPQSTLAPLPSWAIKRPRLVKIPGRQLLLINRWLIEVNWLGGGRTSQSIRSFCGLTAPPYALSRPNLHGVYRGGRAANSCLTASHAQKAPSPPSCEQR